MLVGLDVRQPLRHCGMGSTDNLQFDKKTKYSTKRNQLWQVVFESADFIMVIIIVKSWRYSFTKVPVVNSERC